MDSNLFSDNGHDDTISDIWMYSQLRPNFDPMQMNKAVDFTRQLRKDYRTCPSERFSLTNILDGQSPEVRSNEVSRAIQRRRSTHMNLEKSISLLDDGGGLLSSSKIGTSENKYDFTPLRFNQSNTQDSSIEFSTTNNSLFRAKNEDTYMYDNNSVITSNVELILDEDMDNATSEVIFDEFAHSYQSHLADYQIFDLVKTYKSICEENVLLMSKVIFRAAQTHNKTLKAEKTLNLLKDEQALWQLILSLYSDRLDTYQNEKSSSEMIYADNFTKYQSDHDIVSGLYEKNSQIRQGQLVIDWLEQMNENQLNTYSEHIEFFTDKAAMWENTLHLLHQNKSGFSASKDKLAIHEIDPDAPIRLNSSLEDLDEEDEARLMKYLFACIRAGQLKRAQDICARCGQAWRAATLEGWRLYHDPNFNSNKDVIEAVEGNPFRDIWKIACWKLSGNDKLNKYERALYAALSGNITHILPACDSWSDYVWAYFKVMVDTRVEQEVRLNSSTGRSPLQLPSSYWDKPMSMESIFKAIHASSNEKVKIESKHKFSVIQKYVILGEFDALLEEMYDWVKEDVTLPNAHILRCMTHLVLFFRSISINMREEFSVVILETYVKYLIDKEKIDLIAIYVSVLPPQLQVQWYAQFLETISGTDKRIECLSQAKQAGLDIFNITRAVVDLICNKDQSEFVFNKNNTLINTEIVASEQMKINSIEWLVFEPKQRIEALQKANSINRIFLALKKITAVRATFQMIPSDSIEIICQNWKEKYGIKELGADEANAIREYLCVQAYLEAQDSFNDWFDHFNKAKPQQPQLVKYANFTERVAHEHREKQYQAEYERWHRSLLMQSDITIGKIYNVLLFVDGGWMVDQRSDGTTDEGRTHQMYLLRRICLPDLCFLLHNVLSSTEKYEECLKMADIIASEMHHLYKVFNKEKLQKLSTLLQESSINLLNNNKGCFGYMK